MKATICLRDFNKLSRTVKALTDGFDINDPMNAVTIEFEPHVGGYSLFATINTNYNGVYGKFKTEILGDD